VLCLATRLLDLRSFAIRQRAHLDPRPALLIATLFLSPALSKGQLTTGFVEGTVHDAAGHTAREAAILIEGGAGFNALVHASSAGHFTLSLPYGSYLLWNGNSEQSSQTALALVVAPLQAISVDLVIDSSGSFKTNGQFSYQQHTSSFGLWVDATRAATYPEGFSLQSALVSREAGSLTVPLDFTGFADNRLALVSQRAFSWTGAEFKFQGLNATDSYQPGRTGILPDVQALSHVVVRTGSALITSNSYNNEVGSFVGEPGSSWHGGVFISGTGSPFSSSNLPPPKTRGAVQQPEQFNWFTRDRLEVGGPLTNWADLFGSGAGQWASQTIQSAPPGQDQNSRMLFGTVRSRVRAGSHDQFDAEYSGARVDLSNWGAPAGIEALASRRMSPEFNLPDGFPDEPEADHLNFVEVGWTHLLSAGANLGVLQVRYGYSLDHFLTWPAVQSTPNQSRIELLGSTTAGAPPLDTLAVRDRHEIAIAWQPAALRSGRLRHQITAGGSWNVATPRNRFTAPSDLNVITAAGAPAFIVEYNTPVDSRARIDSTSAYVADHLVLGDGISVDLGALADFSRGSLPAQSSPAGSFTMARNYSALGDLIAWNSMSPRVGLAWQIPHAHGFIVRGTYLRSYSPLAGRYLDYANSNSLGGNVYRLLDRNADGWFQPNEQGAFLLRFGGPYSATSPSLERPYSDQFDVSGQLALTRKTFVSIDLFRRDEKRRIAALDTGLGTNAFTPVPILDPGPDGIPGTFDDQRLTVYQQKPATFGKDEYLLVNAPRLRTLNAGFTAEIGTEWRNVMLHASFTAEKAWGPTNPGNAVFENDPGVIGSLFIDPNSTAFTLARSFVDRAYLGKAQATYRLPSAWGRFEIASIANYLDGLPFARQLLISGLAQGPFLVPTTVRGSPEGGNRAQYVVNWNIRVQREFPLHSGRITASADVLNVMNAGQQIQQSDLSGTSFNSRLPLAIQPPRFVRLGLAYNF
jgi:hypothetical protein